MSAQVTWKHRRRSAQQWLQDKGETMDQLVSEQKPPYLKEGTVMSANPASKKTPQKFPLSLGSVSVCLSTQGFTGDLELHIQSGNRDSGKTGRNEIVLRKKQGPTVLASFSRKFSI